MALYAILTSLPRVKYSTLMLLLSFIIFTNAQAFSRESLIVVIPPMQKSCFSKTFENRIQIVFEFRVTAGGNRDIDARVVSPNGLVIYKALRTSGEEISFHAQGGDFRFCLSNEFSKITSKRIAFNIRPFDEGELGLPMIRGPNGSVAQQAVKGPVATHCDNIRFLLQLVQDFQAKYVVRESAGRFLAETLQGRVTWCAMALSLAMLAAGLGQVLVFKRFFTEKRVSTKPDSEQEEVEM